MSALQAAGSARPESAAEAAARILGIDKPRVFMLDGVPYLEGTVPNYQQKKAAAELIGFLTGAPHVVNRLRVAPRQALGDRIIHQRVQVCFRESPAVDAAAIQSEVRNGVVELRGIVPSLSARCAAECAAWSVGGVASVVNGLRVAGAPDPPESMARQLEFGLSVCLGLPSESVRVEVEKGTVRLAGIVPSPYHRLAAEELVRAHELVQDVVNSLAVSGTTEPMAGPATDKRARLLAS